LSAISLSLPAQAKKQQMKLRIVHKITYVNFNIDYYHKLSYGLFIFNYSVPPLPVPSEDNDLHLVSVTCFGRQRFARRIDDRDMKALLQARPLMSAGWEMLSSRSTPCAMDEFARRPADDRRAFSWRRRTAATSPR
jgi:hypothetical protein